MPTPPVASTPAGSTDVLGRQIAEVIASDLRGSGLFRPMGPAGVKQITFPEVTFPDFPHWSGTNAEALVQGFVRTDGSGNLTVGCYLYRSEEHTSELQSLMRISYAVFCLTKTHNNT